MQCYTYESSVWRLRFLYMAGSRKNRRISCKPDLSLPRVPSLTVSLLGDVCDPSSSLSEHSSRVSFPRSLSLFPAARHYSPRSRYLLQITPHLSLTRAGSRTAREGTCNRTVNVKIYRAMMSYRTLVLPFDFSYRIVV